MMCVNYVINFMTYFHSEKRHEKKKKITYVLKLTKIQSGKIAI